MWNFVLAIHFLVCLFIIMVILLQSGKGSDMGAAFGGSSQTVFGASGGGTFLGKLTAWMAVGFLVTSLLLAYQSTRKRQSNLLKDVQKVEQKSNTSVPNLSGKETKKANPQQGTTAAPAKPQGQAK